MTVCDGECMGGCECEHGDADILVYRILAEVPFQRPAWESQLMRALREEYGDDAGTGRREKPLLCGVEVTAVIIQDRMALSFKSPEEPGSDVRKAVLIALGRLFSGRPNRVLPAMGPDDLVAYLVEASHSGFSGDVGGLPRLSYLPFWLDGLAGALEEGDYFVAFSPAAGCCEDAEGQDDPEDDGEQEPTPADYEPVCEVCGDH